MAMGERLVRVLEELLATNSFRALLILVAGLSVGLIVEHLSRRFMELIGLPSVVEGTAFERSAQRLGTSTVSVVSGLLGWFIYGVTFLIAVQQFQIFETKAFWNRFTLFVPQLFIAAFVIIVGLIVADVVSLLVGERLRGIKLPEVALVPKVVKYTLLYVAVLIALGQVGVTTTALLVLLAAYLFGVVFLGGVAFWQLLRAGATGVYLLLNQPYGIGDEVRIGDYEGIVQGMDVFTTQIEADDEEYIVPNHKVFEHGVRRARD